MSTLFPNSIQPRNGVFVRDRLFQLLQRHSFEATVIAPVPWFPFRNRRFGQYAEFARIERREIQQSVEVFHPRYFMLPRVGDLFSPISYAASVLRLMKQQEVKPFDLIDAHYFFPDGAAAVILGRQLNCPVAITARGSDLNLMPDEVVAGRWIRWAARNCNLAAGVARGLCDNLAAIGTDRQRIRLWPNGVDKGRFAVRDAGELRKALPAGKAVVLSVGNLIELKGHHLVIDALRDLDDTTLVIVGRGPMRSELEQRAKAAGISHRVHFAGEVTQEELIDYYNAADLLVLASRSEGMPNVVLESLSCGTPVVATDVGDLAESFRSSPGIEIVPDRTAGALARAMKRVLAAGYPADVVRSSTDCFDWSTTCDRIAADLVETVHRSRAA